MKFQTKYGYFTDDGREFVITNPQTPRPWINVISNGNYGLTVSQLNGGFSWVGHSNFNRLTRWNQDLILDNWGKYIYLRDDDSAEFWSPTIQPVQNDLQAYQCRHGIGYTKFYSLYNDIETHLRIFVPFDMDLEIWTLTLKNTGSRKRQISIFTYFEWCLGAAPDSHREFHKTFIETEFNEDHHLLLAKKRLWEIPTSRGHWNAHWDYVAFFGCNEPVDGYEGDKEAFIGRYNNLQHPHALKTGSHTQSSGKWNDSIASLHKSIGLNPGESKTVHFYLGAEKSERDIIARTTQLQTSDAIDAAFSKMSERWDQYLNGTTINTPDDAVNFMSNYWLKYQAISGRIWGRAAFYQQSGAFGFRDQLQDSQVFLYNQPQLTKQQIVLHARHQFKEGKVLHWWHPITEQGNDAHMSDDLLWLPFITVQYLKETADWDFLDEGVPFYDDDEPASLLRHCTQAIDWSLNHFSERGLPLILAGDWNDGLSAIGLEGKGESVWLGHFLYIILNEFAFILKHQGQQEKAQIYEERARGLQRAVNDLGWDGNWFWRASKDTGELIGSHENTNGKIFLNAQTWAVISGITTHDRMNQAMDSVEKHLEGKNGPLLLQPAYFKPDFYIGYLSRYAPGARENGGVYTHAATWTIWAECLLNRRSAAYRIYKKICPVYNGMKPDEYWAEPYVTPGNIDGPDSPHYGRGGWSWYTGSAAWLLRMTIDYLLGIRADYDGLVIDPCLPPEWNEVTVHRMFRGCSYHITFRKSTEQKILVDGATISGNSIPQVTDRDHVEVVVETTDVRR